MAAAASVPQFTNRLVKEESPYLLQHAHNPVDWYPWGEEAFAKARRACQLACLKHASADTSHRRARRTSQSSFLSATPPVTGAT